jgi:hypothetical protein
MLLDIILQPAAEDVHVLVCDVHERIDKGARIEAEMLGEEMQMGIGGGRV